MHRDADPFQTSKPKRSNTQQIIIAIVISLGIILALSLVSYAMRLGLFTGAQLLNKTAERTDAFEVPFSKGDAIAYSVSDPFVSKVVAQPFVIDSSISNSLGIPATSNDIYGYFPNDPDADNDHLSDLQEASMKSDINNSDTDKNGINDLQQLLSYRYPKSNNRLDLDLLSSDDNSRSIKIAGFMGGVSKYVETKGVCPQATTWEELDALIDEFANGDGFQDPQAPNRLFVYGYSASRKNCFVRATPNWLSTTTKDIDFDLSLSGYTIVPSVRGLTVPTSTLVCADPVLCYIYNER